VRAQLSNRENVPVSVQFLSRSRVSNATHASHLKAVAAYNGLFLNPSQTVHMSTKSCTCVAFQRADEMLLPWWDEASADAAEWDQARPSIKIVECGRSAAASKFRVTNGPF
jgi:hypothetical protein